MTGVSVASRCIRGRWAGIPLAALCALLGGWPGTAGADRAAQSPERPLTAVAGVRAPDDPEEVRAELARLRSTGAYDAALAFVRELRGRDTGAAAPAWWQTETACIASALERACALPAADRAQLAEADGQAVRFEALLAAEAFGQAAELARAQLATRRALLGEPDLDVADSHNDLGRTLMALGEYDAAVEELGRSLAMRRALLGEDHPLVATALNNLGAALGDRGDFMGCQRLWTQVLAMRMRLLGPAHLQTIGSLHNLGLLYSRLGDYARAARVLSQAREQLIARLGEGDPGTLRTTRALAIAERERGNLERADSLLVRVVELQRAAPERRDEELAWSLFALGEMRERRGQLTSAEELQHEAIACAQAILGARHPSVARFKHALARTLLREGRLGPAELLGRETLEIQRESLGESHADLVESYVLMGRCRRAQGDDAGAVALLEQAARVYETSRRALARDLVRATFQEPPYERLAAAYLHLGRGDDAWRACERGRGRLLAELLAAGSERTGNSATEPFDLARVQSALDDRSAIVGWVDVDDQPDGQDSWVYAIRAAGPVHWVRLDGAGGGLAGELRAELRKPGRLGLAPRMTAGLRDLAHRLWQERIAPVRGDLVGVTRIVVVPSGAMLGVPLEALSDDGDRFLNELWAISYAPSATVYAELRHRPGVQRGTPAMLLLGDPVTDAAKSLWPLPWARAELESLAATLPGAERLTGAGMTESALAALSAAGRLDDFDLIHFATHAQANDEEPQLSALALSGQDEARKETPYADGTAPDGWLTAGEIARTWRLRARLVSLSACETGLGRAVAGEGYVGFAHAFLQAGARNLLVSLWSVSDEATARLMGRFYRNLVERPAGSEGEALQDAKAWLRNQGDDAGRSRWEHPYYWAGFVLFGAGQ